jgi:chemotaxis protein methyltransferase CheR
VTSDDPTLAVTLPVIERRIRERAGLCPPRWMLLGRARERAAALGVQLPGYLRHHAAGPDLDPLIDALRIGETRFYRHPDQMAWLRERLPALLRRAAAEGRPLRAWSAGCATGEEAWTLAMLLCEAQKGGARPEAATVLGTDLSAPALRVAEAGTYPAAAAAALPADLAGRYLVPAPGPGPGPGAGRVAVAASLRAEVPVRFRCHNLLRAGEPGPFDLILCRNVLIYFDPRSRGEALRRLREALVQGGVLLLGPSEAEDSPVPEPAAAPTRQAPLLRLRGAYGGGERLKEELRPLLAQVAGDGVEVDLDGADYLDDDDARILRRAAEVAPLPRAPSQRAPPRPRRPRCLRPSRTPPSPPLWTRSWWSPSWRRALTAWSPWGRSWSPWSAPAHPR